MATWEDGPEYAPHEQPEQFLAPSAAPLDSPPPRPVPPAAPAEQPDFGVPERPVAELASLGTAIQAGSVRDPRAAFSVATTPLTEASTAWSAAHVDRDGPSPGETWAPPTGAPANSARPAAHAPITLSRHRAPGLGGVPQPGTEAWFSPPPAPSPAPAVALSLGAIVNAMTPAVLVLLVVAGVVWGLSPVLFSVAFTLAARIQLAGRAIRRTFAVASAVIVLVAIVALVASPGITASEWWFAVATTSVIASWVVLLTSGALIGNELRRG